MDILVFLKNVVIAIMLLLIAANEWRSISIDKEHIWIEYHDTPESQSGTNNELNDSDTDYDDCIKKSYGSISFLSNLVEHGENNKFKKYSYLSENTTPPPER